MNNPYGMGVMEMVREDQRKLNEYRNWRLNMPAWLKEPPKIPSRFQRLFDAWAVIRGKCVVIRVR